MSRCKNTFTELFNSKISEGYRVVTSGDPIPILQNFIFWKNYKYKHVGQKIELPDQQCTGFVSWFKHKSTFKIFYAHSTTNYLAAIDEYNKTFN